jgi:hypothetical protein
MNDCGCANSGFSSHNVTGAANTIFVIDATTGVSDAKADWMQSDGNPVSSMHGLDSFTATSVFKNTFSGFGCSGSPSSSSAFYWWLSFLDDGSYSVYLVQGHSGTFDKIFQAIGSVGAIDYTAVNSITVNNSRTTCSTTERYKDGTAVISWACCSQTFCQKYGLPATLTATLTGFTSGPSNGTYTLTRSGGSCLYTYSSGGTVITMDGRIIPSSITVTVSSTQYFQCGVACLLVDTDYKQQDIGGSPQPNARVKISL